MPALRSHLEGVQISQGEWSKGPSPFFARLAEGIFIPGQIKEEELLQYDERIVNYWQEIIERRPHVDGQPFTMKYFQYLALLFSEIYLDWYFTRQPVLLECLNRQMNIYRGREDTDLSQNCNVLQDYIASDLNRLSYWSATGSGKTLIMHINLKQYLKYYRENNRDKNPDYLLLLTPNEGLSFQHLNEFMLSGIEARKFNNREGWRLFRDDVIIIEITKLGEERGDKTEAIRAFEGPKLILVDEGHRGAANVGQWMRRRSELIKGGFAFEYSATFSQAAARGQTFAEATKGQSNLTVSQSTQIRATAIREIYAKAILFDYSYKYFYQDGFGKESLLLNLSKQYYAENKLQYFTACLLSFYQQLWLWEEHRNDIEEFNIDKPLWIFVGSTVSKEKSDVFDVVDLFASFLRKQKEAEGYIAKLLQDNLELLNAQRRNIFANRFQPLANTGRTAAEIYSDILKRLFNAKGGQCLKLISAGKSDGEILLHVGNGKPFGVINIGDRSQFVRNAQKSKAFDYEGTNNFISGCFDTINDEGSQINILIGARKFIEGWSSWRVSTMGLLNMGRGEGSQVIQLFGRGVRLKGRGMSLKRSLPNERQGNDYLRHLETLNIFGVRADYMSVFKEHIMNEGFTANEEVIELDFATKSKDLKGQQLLTLKLRPGYGEYEAKGFKRTCFPTLCCVPSELKHKITIPQVVLDRYPIVDTFSNKKRNSGSGGRSSRGDDRNQGILSKMAMACFNWDNIFSALQEHKLQNNYSNLRVNQKEIMNFCQSCDSWYKLFIPAYQLKLENYGNIRNQENILIELLMAYMDRFYRSVQSAYEGSYFESNLVSQDEVSIIDNYEFQIQKSNEGRRYEKRLKELRNLVADGNIGEASKWDDKHMVAITFSQHLYYPLMFADEGKVPLRMRPLAFDAESEIKFVRDLKYFYNKSEGRNLLEGKSLYLLRNAAHRSKGIGFPLAGSFYPDFLLWLVDDQYGKQWLSFVDPKGIRYLNLNGPKFGLYREIKKVEREIKDSRLKLNAFILSITKFSELINNQENKRDLEDRHILFMENENYIEELLRRILSSK